MDDFGTSSSMHPNHRMLGEGIEHHVMQHGHGSSGTQEQLGQQDGGDTSAMAADGIGRVHGHDNESASMEAEVREVMKL